MTTITCPICGGAGERPLMVHRDGECSIETWKCSRCGGLGKLDQERQRQIHEGMLMRRDRIRRGVHLHDEAARLGISLVELSRIERGEL